MLDTITKRRIDDCRDILVGKLPDPKSQIEQITIGLIYKFMDDMDKEAIELGGTAKFFSGVYEQYSWDNLFDTKVTAAEMLRLYSEAIESMEKNPNIPELFSNIFKNAYLPYRDPETLKMFLKTIAEFEYTHSEKLGDAFEYLLSVMGSQGDAGQFRTPRHIIDFLVAAVNPSKTDTIMDPACGTAGFLISAFKHIIENKNDKDAMHGVSTNELTPDERKKLINNFVGYDISPDMVRMSLVNMYLHGFPEPHIFEYDTLSSEERWDESFDVILANPPFMSPKGGIRPHKKFSISSNRSEVLFVDYIAEHLNPNGKAGIIVPEGIIFQSGTAYKDLRKMLVENYLYAVVSLPAGVFNPYSGVKTSILLIDKTVAKKTNDILFIKIDNDGYNLGSQRNAIKGGQLEDAVQLIHEFVASPKKQIDTTISHLVPKTEIAKNGDYNLSGERYKIQIKSNTKYELVLIGELFESVRNGRNVEQIDEEGKYRVTRIQTISDKSIDLQKTKWTNDDIPKDYFMEEGDILLSHINSYEHLAKTAIFTGISEPVVHGTNLIRFKPNKSKIIPEYVAAIFKSNFFIDKARTFAQKAVNQSSIRVPDLKSIKIPLPPLSIQEEIVTEIENYQKIIDGAKMIVENYKPKIDIDADWEMVELGSYCKIKGGYAFKSSDYVENGVQLIRMGNVKEMFFDNENSPSYLSIEFIKQYPSYLLQKDDLLISMTGTVGKEDYGNVCKIDSNEKFLLNQRVGKFEIKSDLLTNDYLYLIANSDDFKQQLFSKTSGGVRQANISNKGIESIIIPLPPIETQQQIVSQIEKEQALVNATKELIAIYEQKIKDRIGKVWGEKEHKTVSKKLSKDLYLAMMLRQMEKKIQLNYGEVATQKTVFNLNTFTSQTIEYPFMNSNYGTYSYQLKDDLAKNPYLSKIKKGNGDVFIITTSKETEVLEALSNPENKEFVGAINEIITIYQTPLINKETENIELLNTVSKVILDTQTIDLDTIYNGLKEWKIDQNGFKTKADKFTKAKTKRMIDLIIKLGLIEKLVKV